MMKVKENVFYQYLTQEIAKHEDLLEKAYLAGNKKHIENNRLVVEKLREVKNELENTLSI